MSSSTTKPDTVLLLGGTGKVGSRLAPLLQAAGIPTLIASRSGQAPAGLSGVKFDWDDESTWEPVLAHPIKAVFLVASLSANTVEAAEKFIDHALERGVSRIVLLSSSSFEEGGPAQGTTHKYLHKLGDEGKVEWAVLRPTWFQENFINFPRLKPLKEKGELHSATGPGRVPWVSTHDIAAVAFHALTSPQPLNTDFMILGPELLTYADLAAIFTSTLNRPIVYHELSESDFVARLVSDGVPPEWAGLLGVLDTAIAKGGEDRTNDVVRTVTGQEPRKFRDFVEENKDAWS